MKKLLNLLLSFFCLSACVPTIATETAKDDTLIRYLDMVELLNTYSDFESEGEYFDISTDVAAIDGGYRYYVFIDNPRIAMYDVEALAIEKDVDYQTHMAANVGIFESEEYHMVPNQSDAELGYVSGLSISATSDHPDITLYILVQWKNAKRSDTYRQYFELPAVYDGGQDE